MAVGPDWSAYLDSLGRELASQANRVRNLIGDVHWLSDGQHKEALLRDLLRRHLPASTLVTHGFVLDVVPGLAPSQEQDILIVDVAASAPVFCSDGLTINTRRSTLACISVKSTLRADKLEKTVDNLTSIPASSLPTPAHPWLGGFFFRTDESFNPASAYASLERLARHVVKTTPPGDSVLGAVATADGLFYLLRVSSDRGRVLVQGHRTPLSTALFVALVCDRVALARGESDSLLGRLVENFEAEPLVPPEVTVGD